MNCPFLLFYYAINNAEKTREHQGFHALFRERCEAPLGENGKQVSPCVIEAFLVNLSDLLIYLKSALYPGIFLYLPILTR